MFGVGMMGMIPILFLIYPTVLGIIAGTVLMLFMSKVQKPWALFILGMISPLVMFAAGHTYVVLVLSLIVMIIAELIRKIGNYNSFKYNMISYAIFSTWICSSMMQMLLAKEVYIEHCRMMGDDYSSLGKTNNLSSHGFSSLRCFYRRNNWGIYRKGSIEETL